MHEWEAGILWPAIQARVTSVPSRAPNAAIVPTVPDGTLQLQNYYLFNEEYMESILPTLGKSNASLISFICFGCQEVSVHQLRKDVI